MATTVRLRTLHEKVKLRGEESQHEQTDAWSNRDLIPLPPHRRTWVRVHGLFVEARQLTLLGMVPLFWLLGDLVIEHWELAATKHILE